MFQDVPIIARRRNSCQGFWHTKKHPLLSEQLAHAVQGRRREGIVIEQSVVESTEASAGAAKYLCAPTSTPLRYELARNASTTRHRSRRNPRCSHRGHDERTIRTALAIFRLATIAVAACSAINRLAQFAKGPFSDSTRLPPSKLDGAFRKGWKPQIRTKRG